MKSSKPTYGFNMELPHLGSEASTSFLMYDILRPPSLSDLTTMIFDIGLTHLGSEASISSLTTIQNKF